MFKLLKGDVFKKKKKEPPSPPSNLVSYSPPLQASLTDTNSKEISSTTHNSLVVAPAVLEDSTVDVVEVVDRQEYVKTGVDVQVTSEESFGVNGGHEIKKTKVVLLLDGDGDAVSFEFQHAHSSEADIFFLSFTATICLKVTEEDQEQQCTQLNSFENSLQKEIASRSMPLTFWL